MDWMVFVVEVLKAVAWPFVVFFFAWQVRKPVKQLIAKAKSVKLPGVEVELDNAERAVEQSTAALPSGEGPLALLPPKATTAAVVTNVAPELVEADLVKYAPLGAIIAGWAVLEAKLSDYANWLSWPPPPGFTQVKQGLSMALKVLTEHLVLDPVLTGSIKNLHNVRNEAAHTGGDAEVTAAVAARFIELRDRTLDVIRKRVESARRQHLLKELGVGLPKEVIVGPKGVVIDTAHGEEVVWSAHAGDKVIAVCDADVGLLLDRGAKERGAQD